MSKYTRALFIVNALYDYGDLSLADLNDLWTGSNFCEDGLEISPKTFGRDKEYIKSAMQIEIEYDYRNRKYTLSNPEIIEKNQLYRYLLGIFHIGLLNELAIEHQDRIMFEQAPTGVGIIHQILIAIDTEKTINFDYHSYYAQGKNYHFEVIPCFVRLFEGRWYVVCEYLDRSATRVLALERISRLSVGDTVMRPSPHITPEEFYTHCFGVIHDNQPPLLIKIKAFTEEAAYIRSVPLHSSQEEIQRGEGFAIFSYYLRPSSDFIQRLLWHQDRIVVLSPESVRQTMKTTLEKMLNRYE